MAEGHSSGWSPQLGPMLRMLRHVPQRRTDRRPGGVDAGDQHQEARAQDVVVGNRLAVDLGLHHVGDQVVLARIDPPIGDLLLEEPQDPDALLDAQLRVGQSLLEEAAHPPDELVGPVRAHAQHRGDHPHRDLLGVVGIDVGPAGGDEPVDQSVAELAGAVLVLLDHRRREHRQDEPASPRVVRRVGRDGRCAHVRERVRRCVRVLVHLGQGDHDRAQRAEALDVGRQLTDGLVPRRQPRSAPPLGVRDGALLPQACVRRVGIDDELGIEDVVVAGRVVDGHGVNPRRSRRARGRSRRPGERRPRARPGRRPR